LVFHKSNNNNNNNNKSLQNNNITMTSNPNEALLIDTFPNTIAWRHDTDGTLRPITMEGGVDLWVHFIESETKLRLRMKEGTEIDASWILNTYVPKNNVFLRYKKANRPNMYIFKDWSATEPGRNPGQRDMFIVEFDSLENSFRFVSYFMMAATQEISEIQELFPLPPAVRTPPQQDEEREVEEEDVVDDDDKSQDLLATDDEDDDTLGSINDNNIRHEEADDDNDEHLGFVDCSQQHVFHGMSNLRL
jgi:hypothetical protein